MNFLVKRVFIPEWKEIKIKGPSHSNIESTEEYICELPNGWLYRIDQNVCTPIAYTEGTPYSIQTQNHWEYRTTICFIPDENKQIEWEFKEGKNERINTNGQD